MTVPNLCFTEDLAAISVEWPFAQGRGLGRPGTRNKNKGDDFNTLCFLLRLGGNAGDAMGAGGAGDKRGPVSSPRLRLPLGTRAFVSNWFDICGAGENFGSPTPGCLLFFEFLPAGKTSLFGRAL